MAIKQETLSGSGNTERIVSATLAQLASDPEALTSSVEVAGRSVVVPSFADHLAGTADHSIKPLAAPVGIKMPTISPLFGEPTIIPHGIAENVRVPAPIEDNVLKATDSPAQLEEVVDKKTSATEAEKTITVGNDSKDKTTTETVEAKKQEERTPKPESWREKRKRARRNRNPYAKRNWTAPKAGIVTAVVTAAVGVTAAAAAMLPESTPIISHFKNGSKRPSAEAKPLKHADVQAPITIPAGPQDEETTTTLAPPTTIAEAASPTTPTTAGRTAESESQPTTTEAKEVKKAPFGVAWFPKTMAACEAPVREAAAKWKVNPTDAAIIALIRSACNPDAPGGVFVLDQSVIDDYAKATGNKNPNPKDLKTGIDIGIWHMRRGPLVGFPDTETQKLFRPLQGEIGKQTSATMDANRDKFTYLEGKAAKALSGRGIKV